MILKNITDNNLIALKYINPDGIDVSYPFNPNGSINNIAGITNFSGNVFGLMPHPEAFIFNENNPHWTENKNKKFENGLRIFKNGINYFK